MTQLSWQPSAVTKCGQITITDTGKHECKTMRRGSEKLCPDCNPRPMWIEQNKETPNANT